MLDYINEMNMERQEDHEICKSDKIEYNKLLQRVKKYSLLSKELQDKHANDFSELLEKIDNLIFEMGVDNASTDEWQNGFKIEEDKK